jgi:hypothetical protein
VRSDIGAGRVSVRQGLSLLTTIVVPPFEPETIATLAPEPLAVVVVSVRGWKCQSGAEDQARHEDRTHAEPPDHPDVSTRRDGRRLHVATNRQTAAPLPSAQLRIGKIG